MPLNKSQVSLLITGVLMSAVVLLLFNTHLGDTAAEAEGITIDLVKEPPKKTENKKPKANTSPLKTHRAFNETAKPTPSQPKPLKIRKALREIQPTPSNPEELLKDNDPFMNKLRQLVAKRKTQQQLLKEQTILKEVRITSTTDRRTSVSYALVERNAYFLPTPVYTCIEGGKVVINIKVDDRGYVTKAYFNPSSSETRNGCLVDNALTYARKARFSPSSPKAQEGTITYQFQAK